MMKIVFQLLLIVLTAPVLAQPYRSDSVYLQQQAQQEMAFAQQTATQLNASPIDRMGMLQLNVVHAQGGFRRAQQAYKNTTTNFYSEGIATLKRFKVSGSFLFNKVWEDSLAFTMKGIEDEAQPYYYFAGKAGKYERQNYEMKATVSYELLRDKLYLSTGMSYTYHWTTRSVDPRPNIRFYKLLFSPSVTYKMGKHLVGGGFTWGTGNEVDNISYKNKNYAGNQSYLDRNSFLSLGYGHISKRYDNLYRYTQYKCLTADYAWQSKVFTIKAIVDYHVSNDDNRWEEKGAIGSSTYSSFKSAIYKGSLLLQKSETSTQQQLSFTASLQNADNWTSEFNAMNYSFRQAIASAQYLHLFNKQKKLQPELGVVLAYNHLEKKDRIGAHEVSVNHIQPALVANLYKHNIDGSRLMIGLSPGVRLPFGNSLTVPATQVNYFTTGIVYPDYLYWDATALETGCKAAYITAPIKGVLKAGFSVQATLLNRLKASEKQLDALSVPGNSRLLLSVAANLYF